MQRALCIMLLTENGTEKLDNELITTLFENITTLAQLHQFTRAEGKTKNNRSNIQKKRDITQKVTVPRFPPEYAPTTPSSLVPTLVEICCSRVERSLMLRITSLWTFAPDHPTISNLTFRSHSPSVDVFACYVSTLDDCCVLIVRRRNNHTKFETCRAWLEFTFKFDTPPCFFLP